MKSRTVVCGMLAAFLLLFAAQLLAQSSTKVLNPNNPPAFQKYAAPVSSRLAFLASEKGKQFLLHAPNPIAKSLLKEYHGADAAAQWDSIPHKYLTQGRPSAAASQAQHSITPASGPATRCSGTRFNLEPAANALPQNEQSVAFKTGGGSTSAADMAVEVSNDFRGFFLPPALFSPSVSGYYVEDTAGCTPRFEGGTPLIPDPYIATNYLTGGGDPIVNYNPNNDNWYYSSIHESEYDVAIGVFRNTTANLKSCASGTHNLTTSTSCWPASWAYLSDEQSVYYAFTDKPDSWVDTRASGTGAGNVYISNTLFGYYGSEIDLDTCDATLTNCSGAMSISGFDTGVQFSDIKTTANGTITVTYGNYYTIFLPTTSMPIYAVDIKYVVCTPNGAPTAPSCNFPVLVKTDYAPIVDGLASLYDVRNSTYPVHAEATGGSYVFWEHCGSYSDLPYGNNYVCPDADIVGTLSTNSGATWGSVFAVDNAYGHQIQPWASYDTSADKIVIAYQNCNGAGKTACEAGYRTITPTGGTTVGAFHAVSSYAYPEADANVGYFAPLFGDYIGVSAHDGHSWYGYTDTLRLGTYGYGTELDNDSNNNVAAVDNP